MESRNLVSVIIRSHNEEIWLRHSIEAVNSQNLENVEIVLVDNNSTDRSVAIAKKLGVKKIVNLEKYNPGKAINLGISVSNAKYIAILSAHCIPYNNYWLKEMVDELEKDKSIAGAYSRQVPLPFSNPSDSRDLFITFSSESRTQKSDSFFHNGSSLIRYESWKSLKFNEDISNIEDRIWANEQQSKGFLIRYCAKSIVFHHHGIHQNTDNTSRSKSTVDIIRKKFYPYGSILPESMLPESQKVLCVISSKKFSGYKDKERIKNCIRNLKKSDLNIFIALIIPKNQSENRDIDNNLEVDLVYEIKHQDSLEKCLSEIVNKAEEKLIFDYTFYLNLDYFHSMNIDLKNNIKIACENGYDSIIPAFEDKTGIVIKNENQNLKILNNDLVHLNKKEIHRKLLLGQGSLSRNFITRKGKLITEDSNIFFNPTNNILHTIRLDTEAHNSLMNYLDKNE